MPNKQKGFLELALVAYAFSVMLFAGYFNWQFANENGFIAWVFLGQIVPTLKALVWPFFINW